MVTIRRLGQKVAPKSMLEIRKKAIEFRNAVQQKKPYIQVTALLEVLQNTEFLEFEIVNDLQFGEEEAISYPDQSFMQIKQSIYEKAHQGDGHCRFTIAHEFGHILMHREQASYARGSTGDHAVFEDSEWQADTFASEFLIDQRLIPPNISTYEICNIFGVSYSAASRRLERFHQEK